MLFYFLFSYKKNNIQEWSNKKKYQKENCKLNRQPKRTYNNTFLCVHSFRGMSWERFAATKKKHKLITLGLFNGKFAMYMLYSLYAIITSVIWNQFIKLLKRQFIDNLLNYWASSKLLLKWLLALKESFCYLVHYVVLFSFIS